MATAFQWIKLLLENSRVLLTIILFLLSLTGWSAYSLFEKDELIIKYKNQLEEKKTDAKKKCGSCTTELKNHNKEYH